LHAHQQRFLDPPHIHTHRLMLVAVLGLFVNLLGIFVFNHGGHGHSHGGDDHGHSHGGASAFPPTMLSSSA
jgi:solute carrier family 30 (zinc transporter), member 5/7